MRINIVLALLLSSLSFPWVAQAHLITTAGNETTAQIEGQSFRLFPVGKGLRTKAVVFVQVNVYNGELFVNDPATFKKSEVEALTSLDQQKAVAIQLHFLRNLDALTIQKSFKECLALNGVNLEDPSIKLLLNALVQGGDIKKDLTLTILGTRMADGSELVSYEATSGQANVVKGSTGFIHNVFSIWLGKTSDLGMTRLKHELLQKTPDKN